MTGAAGDPELADGTLVTGEYFTVLGVSAALGRTIAPEDAARPGTGAVTVVSDAFWRTHLAPIPPRWGGRCASKPSPSPSSA